MIKQQFLLHRLGTGPWLVLQIKEFKLQETLPDVPEELDFLMASVGLACQTGADTGAETAEVDECEEDPDWFEDYEVQPDYEGGLEDWQDEEAAESHELDEDALAAEGHAEDYATQELPADVSKALGEGNVDVGDSSGFDTLGAYEAELVWKPTGIVSKKKDNTGWSPLSLSDIQKEMLPPREGVRLTRHFPRFGFVRWQVWYPPLQPLMPDSNSVTVSTVKSAQGLDVVLDWAWKRHSDWEQQLGAS